MAWLGPLKLRKKMKISRENVERQEKEPGGGFGGGEGWEYKRLRPCCPGLMMEKPALQRGDLGQTHHGPHYEVLGTRGFRYDQNESHRPCPQSQHTGCLTAGPG